MGIADLEQVAGTGPPSRLRRVNLFCEESVSQRGQEFVKFALEGALLETCGPGPLLTAVERNTLYGHAHGTSCSRQESRSCDTCRREQSRRACKRWRTGCATRRKFP